VLLLLLLLLLHQPQCASALSIMQNQCKPSSMLNG
jgi:hypothetical protein